MIQSKLQLPSGVYVTGAALVLTLAVIVTTAGLSATRTPPATTGEAIPTPSTHLDSLNIEERMVQARMVRVVRQAEVAQARLDRRVLSKEFVDLRRGRTRRVPSLMFYARHDERNWKAGRPLARVKSRPGASASARRYTRSGARGGPAAQSR